MYYKLNLVVRRKQNKLESILKVQRMKQGTFFYIQVNKKQKTRAKQGQEICVLIRGRILLRKEKIM